MILKKTYDEKSGTQKVWYQSSMIKYSEMVEDESENKGNLFVTFNNGDTYVYKNVTFQDYLAFIGASTDASYGKTLNRVIKQKYEYEKVGKSDVEAIQKALDEDEEPDPETVRNSTYFISGHRDITEKEFTENYAKAIDIVLSTNPEACFVVGDYYGVDIMAQDYLLDARHVDPSKVTVYHMGDKPRNSNPKVTNFHGNHTSDEDRDAAMTEASFEDIAFVRDHTKLSGTAQNILRRRKFNV